MRSKTILKHNSVHGSNQPESFMTLAHDTRVTRYKLKPALKCRLKVSTH